MLKWPLPEHEIIMSQNRIIAMNRTLKFAVVASIAAAALSVITMKAFFKNPSSSASTDSEGHRLVSLWSDYSAAERADRPEKQLEILTKIKREASAKHYAWDFYDAGEKYVRVGTSRNWKLRDSLSRAFMEEVEAFGEPVAVFMSKFASRQCSPDELLKYLKDNSHKLKTSHNQGFYSNAGIRYGRSVPGQFRSRFYTDDYGFALWSLLGSVRAAGFSESLIFNELSSYEGDSYPLGAFLGYLSASAEADKDARNEALKAFAGKYSGKAVALWAEKDLLNSDFHSLKESHGEEPYRQLYERCKAFERSRSSFSETEKAIVNEISEVSSLMGMLSAKSLNINVSDNQIKVFLRNLEQVEVTLAKEGTPSSVKPLAEKLISNPRRSFYVTDTVYMELPALPDGEYRVKARSGKTEASNTFQSYHISLAGRNDNRGYCIYAACWDSGEPVRKADIRMLKNGNVCVEAKGFEFDGFTPLPEDMLSKLGGRASYSLICSYLDRDGLERRSEELYIYGHGKDAREENTSFLTDIFTDQGAYNPGDSVKFKAVMYHADNKGFAETLPAGEKVVARLQDAEGNMVEEIRLETNEFGSVAGCFKLPVGRRNGWFTITVSDAMRRVRVDEFVLPSFDLSFDMNESLNLPGDTVSVTGKVESFSGHSLAGVKATYSVESWGRVISQGEVTIESDGAFKVEFPAEESSGWRAYSVSVKIADNTGETREYSKMIWTAGGLNVRAELLDAAPGRGELIDESESESHGRFVYNRGSRMYNVSGDNARISLKVANPDGGTVPVDVRYALADCSGKRLMESSAASGSVVDIDLSSYASGVYRFIAECSAVNSAGVAFSDSTRIDLMYLKESGTVLDAPVKDFLMVPETEVTDSIRIVAGNADGHPVWAVVEVFGPTGEILDRRFLFLKGERGAEGSLARLAFPYKSDYPEAVRLQVFYFRDGNEVTFSEEYRRAVAAVDFPLEWNSFIDRSVPGSECEVSLKTSPDAEVLAAVFDKSTETVAPNIWTKFSKGELHVPEIYVNAVCGRVGGHSYIFDYIEDNAVVGYGTTRSFRAKALAAAPTAMMDVASAEAVEEAAAPDIDSADGPDVREDFSTSLAFMPFLRPDNEGNLSFSFRTSDKLSTYYVSVYAHAKDMRNAVMRREMVVTIPVKLSVLPPEGIYSGDKLDLAVSLSSAAEVPVAGSLKLSVYYSADYQVNKPVREYKQSVEVPAGGSVASMFNLGEIACPGCPVPDTLGLKVVFTAVTEGGKFSDGVFVTVPVYPDVQTVTESHSAVYRSGDDKGKILESLRSAFVNGTSVGSEYKEISIMEMLEASLPSKVDPANDDVLSLSEALYVRKVAASLGKGNYGKAGLTDEMLMDKIFACRNADGGFSWFEGMRSSPVITAVILERFGKMRSAGLADLDLASSVKYLDSVQFSGRSAMPFWCGGIDDRQYMFVRSMYPEVAFAKPASGKDDGNRFRTFCKDAGEYLVPKKERGMNGYIMGKVRRVATLRNLLASDAGIALAKAWGLSLNVEKRVSASLDADILSLTEYAVDHRDGGVYYPNLVMPFRGLLESEAYAHSMLCDLLSGYAADYPESADAGRIADGIRIWLMLQKETQHWDADPAFVDAVNSVMNGSEAVKSTSVLVMTKSFEKPFAEVRAAGNGFSVRKRFFREVTVRKEHAAVGETPEEIIELQEIADGELLHVGEKVTMRCEIHNDENRSFVKVTVPREAAFRPVNELSGHYGLGVRPVRVNGWYSFMPQGYRNVKAMATEYYFDSYPEEDTVIEEELFVTRPGRFVAPAVEVESLYAPHYRANSAFYGTVLSE